MLLDATHLSDQSFWEALEVFEGPVLASHHNCRALVPGDRQLSDEQIQALVARGAVIGAAFDCWMIKPGWKKHVTDPKTVSMEDIANHTDHICQLAGNAKHCGLGTDLDGGFGKEQTPHDLDTIADLGPVRGNPRQAGLFRRGHRRHHVPQLRGLLPPRLGLEVLIAGLGVRLTFPHRDLRSSDSGEFRETCDL